MGCCSTRNKEMPLYGLQSEDFLDSDLSKSKKTKSGAGHAKSRRREDSLKITYKNADMNYVSSDEREEITYIKKIYSSIKQAKNKEGEDTLRSSSKKAQETQPQTVYKINNFNICSCRQSLKTRPSDRLNLSNFIHSKDDNNSISVFNNECFYNEKSNKLNLELSSISKITYNKNWKVHSKISPEYEDTYRCKSTRIERKKSLVFERFPANSLCHRLYSNQNQGGSFFSASLNEKYLSICSNTIISNNECSHTLIGKSGEEEKSRNQQVLRGIFTSEVFKAICFEFENVIVWGINEFKTKFRELKLILVIEINNSKETQEKIPLINRSGDNITFVPLLKKYSNKQPCRIVKYFPSRPLNNLTNQSEDSSIIENFTCKNQSTSEKIGDYNELSLQLCTYDSKSSKLVVISSDEEYFKIANQNQFQKIKFHKNLYMTNSEKKAAHLLYSIAYCVEPIPQSEELFKKEIIECRLSHLTSQIVPPDNPIGRFVFNKSKNTHLKQSKIKINKSFSVQDLENIQIPTAVKSCASIVELLDILDKVTYKYDLVEILTFIEKYITSSDLQEECIKGYRQRLCQLIGELKTFLRKDDTFFSFFMNHLKFAFFISKRTKKRWSTSKRGSDNIDHNLSKKLNSSIVRLSKGITKIDCYESTESLSLEDQSISAGSTSNILNDQPEIIYLYESLFNHLIEILKHKPKPLHVQLITEFINKSVKSIENDFTKLSLLLTNLEVFLCLMLNFSQCEECVAPLTSILSYICLMFKKQNKDRIFLESPEHNPTSLAELSEEKYTKCLFNILEDYPYNSMIVINVLRISRYLLEKQLFSYSSIFQFENLREIFCSHTLNNFDDLHICILGTVKGIFNASNTTNITTKEYSSLIGMISFTFILCKNKIISSMKDDNSKLKVFTSTMFNNLAFAVGLISKWKELADIKEFLDKELFLKNLIDFIFFGLLESNFIASYQTLFNESDISTQICLYKFYNSVLELLFTKSLVQVSQLYKP